MALDGLAGSRISSSGGTSVAAHRSRGFAPTAIRLAGVDRTSASWRGRCANLRAGRKRRLALGRSPARRAQRAGRLSWHEEDRLLLRCRHRASIGGKREILISEPACGDAAAQTASPERGTSRPRMRSVEAERRTRLIPLRSLELVRRELDTKETPANLQWSQPGSNRRPPACKAGALPAELWPLGGDSRARSKRS